MTMTFLLASARANGNSEQLARHAATSLGDDLEQRWLALRDYPLPVFEDKRHAGRYDKLHGNAKILAEATLAAQRLVFVTPVYWYSVPTPLKLYLDHWSHWMRVESLKFKEKMSSMTLWVVAASAGAATEAEPMLESLRLCGKYLDMKWGGHVLGNGSKPGDVLNDSDALKRAAHLFQTDVAG